MSSDGRNPEAAGSDRQHPLKAMHIVETHPFLSPLESACGSGGNK